MLRRNLEKQLADDDKSKRLRKLLKGLDRDYDRIKVKEVKHHG